MPGMPKSVWSPYELAYPPVPDVDMLAGMALIIDIRAKSEAETWSCVTEPPTGILSLMQEAENTTAAMIAETLIIVFFISYASSFRM